MTKVTSEKAQAKYWQEQINQQRIQKEAYQESYRRSEREKTYYMVACVLMAVTLMGVILFG